MSESEFISTGSTTQHFYDCIFKDPSGFTYMRYKNPWSCHVVQPIVPGGGLVPELRWTTNKDEVQPIGGVGQPEVGANYIREVSMVQCPPARPQHHCNTADSPRARLRFSGWSARCTSWRSKVRRAARWCTPRRTSRPPTDRRCNS